MTATQRNRILERLVRDVARAFSESLGVDCMGTLRKLPPPPLPGESPGTVRYYVNTLAAGSRATRLVEFTPRLYEAIRSAEDWAATGRGRAPSPNAVGKLFPRKIKTSR